MNRAWSLSAIAIAGVVGLPIIVVLLELLAPASPNWAHLAETVLTDYLVTTAGLMILTGMIAALLGVSTAWIVATQSFPLRSALSWALVLPLAMPAYVIAYVYTDLLDYSAPLQVALRTWLGEGFALPPVRSLGGAAIMMGFVLYPYVYLLARASFAASARSLFEAARVLGATSTRAFWTVALPVARPAIAGGLILVLMETAADYGVADYFGLSTFTTGIFRTWYGLGDKSGAVQLAGWLFIVVAMLILAERWARRGERHNPTSGGRAKALESAQRPWLATLWCLIPVVVGFIVPTTILVVYAIRVGDPQLGSEFLSFIGNTALVATLGALVAVALALVLSYAERLSRNPVTQLGIQVATLGYALPGALISVGILVPLTIIDRQIAIWMRDVLEIAPSLLLTGSVFALVFAYVGRFLTVAYNACSGGLAKIHSNLDAVARSLGANPRRILREIHLPMISGSVASGVMLVFIDITKELPATLILRPFNFETLATRVYRLASDERIAEASTAALLIVLIGILPSIVLSRTVKERTSE